MWLGVRPHDLTLDAPDPDLRGRVDVREPLGPVVLLHIALDGVRQENTVGSRTVLDVLDAEQEYLNAQVSLVRAQRDEIVARYQLYAAIGKLTARNLQLDVPYYDEVDHYEQVRDKWTGLDGYRDYDKATQQPDEE